LDRREKQSFFFNLVSLPLPQLLDGLQARRGKRDDSFSAVEMHPLATLMQNALEAFVVGKVRFQLRHLYAVEYLLHVQSLEFVK
jgi:hypothetical protein